ncbi:MAG: class I SAM-dependent methyltransferase [Carbonactinosporaceae bacterium]
MPGSRVHVERWRRYWDKHSGSYDKQIAFFERHLFADTRSWVCRQASGDVLEVAIGTGLNLYHYPAGVRLTGVEFSPAMLELARQRADDHPLAVDLRLGDAQSLDLPDACFDTVVCTFSLCAIPDEKRAITEMHRVLRPGGLLLLADHVASTAGAARVVQRLLELATVPLGGEHFLRRPLELLQPSGFEIECHERFKLGIVERLTARKPTAEQQNRQEHGGPGAR